MSGYCTHLSVKTLAVAHTAILDELNRMRGDEDGYGPSSLRNRMFNETRVAAVQLRRQLGYTDTEGMVAHGDKGMAR